MEESANRAFIRQLGGEDEVGEIKGEDSMVVRVACRGTLKRRDRREGVEAGV